MLPRAIPLLLIPSLLMAQDAPLELLKRVAANYRALIKTTYDFERVEVREDSRNRTERRERIEGSGGRYRYTANGRVYLVDGQYGWTFDPERNEYTKVEARFGPILAPSLYELQNLDTPVKSARFLRAESVEMQTGSVMCQVIEVERVFRDSPAPYSAITYWIDASHNLVLKVRYSYTMKDVNWQTSPPTVMTVSFPKAEVGQAIDEQLFRFTPPENSVQVERLGFGPKSRFIGKDSPDFEWKGADGKVISFAALKQQVVLMVFDSSASEATRFSLETIYRSFWSNGLNAIYVVPALTRLAGETERYTVPVVVDTGGVVAKRFGFTWNGTVLIGRDGKVVYLQEYQNAEELGRALHKLEIW